MLTRTALLLLALAVSAAASAQDTDDFCPQPPSPAGTPVLLDSVRVAYQLEAEEAFYTDAEEGVPAFAMKVYREWAHVPGTPYYRSIYELCGETRPFSQQLEGVGVLSEPAEALFPKALTARPGNLIEEIYGRIIYQSPNDGDPRTNEAEDFRQRVERMRAEIRGFVSTFDRGLYAARAPAPLVASVAFDRASVEPGEPFEVVVEVRNPWRVAARNVGPRGDIEFFDAAGEAVAVEVLTAPGAVATLAGGATAVLRYRARTEQAGQLSVAVDVGGRWTRYYPEEVAASSACDAGRAARRGSAASCTLQVGGLAFLADGAFMEQDSLFWPDTTYTLKWSPGEAETVEIRASLLADPDPENDAHWPIAVVAGFDAAAGEIEWTVPQAAVSPTVHLRIRDEDDDDAVDVSARARVRYGWHLTRVATDASGEKRYEPFDPARHGWREDAPNALTEWVAGYYADEMLGVRDAVASAETGTTVEMDVEMDYLFGEKGRAYSYGPLRVRGRAAVFPSLPEYLENRRNRVARTLPDDVWRGTPSWTSVAFAFGLPSVYGQPSPVLVAGPSPAGPPMSQIHPGIALYHASNLWSGQGMCYGLAWSALLMFQAPEAFATWYRPLHPTLQPVRELRTVPMDAGALEVIGAVFTAQSRSGGRIQPGSVEELEAALESDDPDDDRVLAGLTHAVLPYRVEKVGPDAVQVRIHDRTFPGQDDRQAVSVLPVVDGVIGGPGTNEFGFTAERYSDFLKPVALSSDITGAVPTVRGGPGTVVEVAPDAARRGGAPQPIRVYRNDPDLPPAGYTVPAGPFRFTARALAGAGEGVSATVTTPAGTAFGVSRPDAAPADVDSLAVSAAGLTYLGVAGGRHPSFDLTATGMTGTRRAQVGPMTVGGGQSVTSGWAGDGVRLANGAGAQAYDLALVSTAGGVETFAARAIEIGAGAVHTVRPDWAALDADALLIDVDDDGDGTVDRTITIVRATPAEDGLEALPARVALGAPFPNPARGTATVVVEVPEAGAVRLSVYDALGREVVTAFDGPMSAGRHAVALDVARLPAGVYVARLTAARGAAVQRMTVVR